KHAPQCAAKVSCFIWMEFPVPRSHSAVFAASPFALTLCLALPVTAAEDAVKADSPAYEHPIEAAENTASLKLGDVLVRGQRRSYEGPRAVDRDQIEKMPSG